MTLTTGERRSLPSAALCASAAGTRDKKTSRRSHGHCDMRHARGPLMMTWGQVAHDIMADLPAEERSEALVKIIDSMEDKNFDATLLMIEERRRLRRDNQMLTGCLVIAASLGALGWLLLALKVGA